MSGGEEISVQIPTDAKSIIYDHQIATADNARDLGIKDGSGFFAVDVEQVILMAASTDNNTATILLKKLNSSELEKFKSALIATIATQVQKDWVGMLGFKEEKEPRRSFFGLFKDKEVITPIIQQSMLRFILNQGSTTGEQHDHRQNPTKSLATVYRILHEQKLKKDQELAVASLPPPGGKREMK